MIHRIGDTTEDGQLRIGPLTEKGLEVTFLETGETVFLAKRKPVEIPIWFAELKLAIENERPFYVRLGETFQLSREPQRTLRLTRVEEKGAEIIDEASGETSVLGSLKTGGKIIRGPSGNRTAGPATRTGPAAQG